VNSKDNLNALLSETFASFDNTMNWFRFDPSLLETGRVKSMGRGIALIEGLPNVRSEELVILEGGVPGMVFNLDRDDVGVILFSASDDLHAGSIVKRTGRVMDVPVGNALLGRVLDAMASPLDNLGPIGAIEKRPIEQDAPAIMDRDPVTVPLHTGIKVIDALIPIGRRHSSGHHH
jgi:F-type H+-transporting ATPase subunit alpha